MQPIRVLEVDVLIFVVDVKHVHGTQNAPYRRQRRRQLALVASKRIAYVFLLSNTCITRACNHITPAAYPPSGPTRFIRF